MKKFFLIRQSGISSDNMIIAHLHKHGVIVDNPARADCIIVLGGDGAMLKAIRTYRELDLVFAGFNYGHIGFLMNMVSIETLQEILNHQIEVINVNMLKASLYDSDGLPMGMEYSFNDFYFERATTQAAKFRITVNGKERFDSLTSDGAIVCTSAGSTAYNASAGGIILPIGTNSMVLTGVCPAVFQHWRTSQLSADSVVILEPLDTKLRPVRFLADGIEKEHVGKAVISYSDKIVRVAFSRSQNFREKVLELQFERRKR
jgi:NAD+ kinase